MIHCLFYLDGVYIKMESAMTVGLTVLTVHSFIEARIRHCGIFILRSRLLILTKCKRTTKITRKIKRSKQSHCYYLNSVATDRLVLAGDVETNPGSDDAKTAKPKGIDMESMFWIFSLQMRSGKIEIRR